MDGYFLNLTDAKGNDEKIGGHLIEKKPIDINNMAVHFSSPCESVHESDGVSWTDATSDPRADAVSSETMEANRPQVFDTRCGENSSTSFLRLFLTGSTTITSIFSNTSRKLVMPIRFSSVYGEDIARSLFLSRKKSTFSDHASQICRTHMAQFLHVGHQQGEAMSEGRVVLCADLFDQWAQQHLTVIRDGQDGCQLDRGVAKSRHHSCKETAAGCSEISLCNILKIGRYKDLYYCLLWELTNNDYLNYLLIKWINKQNSFKWIVGKHDFTKIGIS